MDLPDIWIVDIVKNWRHPVDRFAQIIEVSISLTLAVLMGASLGLVLFVIDKGASAENSSVKVVGRLASYCPWII